MDWVATIFSVVGILLNSKKLIWCWPVWAVSTLLWASFAVQNRLWSLLVVQIAFFLTNIYGWRQWWLDDQATVVTEQELKQREKL